MTRETCYRKLRQTAEVHDGLHPDKDKCGGIGRCELMRLEHALELQLIAVIRKGWGVSYNEEAYEGLF